MFPLGKSFAAVGKRQMVLYDYEDGMFGERIPLGTTAEMARVAASPGGEAIATFGTGNLISLWDARSGRHLGAVRGHDNTVYGAAFDPIGRIVSAGRDHLVRVSPQPDRERAMTLRGHQGRIWSVAFSPNGKMLASASANFASRGGSVQRTRP